MRRSPEKTSSAIIVFTVAIAFAALNAVALAACGEGKRPTWNDIERVRYERTGCIGTCPGYEVVFSKDGYYYVGRRYVDMPGTYEAAYSDRTFNEVIQVLRSLNFYEINIDTNEPFATDTTDLIISVHRCGVETKVFWPWYAAGRKDIPALFNALDRVTKKTPWRKKSDSLDSPAE